MLKVAVIDYGVGNVCSVFNAVAYLGYQPVITSVPGDILSSDALILPGVGAYHPAMARLATGPLREALDLAVLEQRRPVLGICLGMQLMMDGSDEGGPCPGLGWIPGWTKALAETPEQRSPHIGWNELQAEPNSGLFGPESTTRRFYFCHSFRVDCQEDVIIGYTVHGQRFPAALRRKNIFGVQFHPEKSQVAGLKLLRSFFNQDALCRTC